MVLTIFLFTNDSIVFIAKQSLLSLTTNFPRENPNLDYGLARLPKILFCNHTK
jgi:hypothetical protein